jgi:hypothetical protein
MNNNNKIVLNFLYKFLCILKAASDGWIISYIGANKFAFSYRNKKINISDIIKKYTSTLPSIIAHS